MAKIIIDQELCIGCGACTEIQEGVIQIDPAIGKAKAIGPVKDQETAKQIIEVCPVGAIKEEA